MSAQVIPFIYNDKPVRSITYRGESWFVGKDVCNVLDLKNHNQILGSLDADGRGGEPTPTPSGDQEMVIISEPGVYRLVLTSRKPEAEAFKRWLAHDVLPQLRQIGIRLDYEQDAAFLGIANRSAWLDKAFEGTAWAEGEHRHALSRLPGARAGRVNKVGGNAASLGVSPAAIHDDCAAVDAAGLIAAQRQTLRAAIRSGRE